MRTLHPPTLIQKCIFMRERKAARISFRFFPKAHSNDSSVSLSLFIRWMFETMNWKCKAWKCAEPRMGYFNPSSRSLASTNRIASRKEGKKYFEPCGMGKSIRLDIFLHFSVFVCETVSIKRGGIFFVFFISPSSSHYQLVYVCVCMCVYLYLLNEPP